MVPNKTPFCRLCGAQIEFLEDCVVMLRSQFMWFEEDRYAPLVIDPDAPFEVVQFGDNPPQRALVVNPDGMGTLTVVHKDCLEDELTLEDEDDEDTEDLDADMQRALERDEFPDDVGCAAELAEYIDDSSTDFNRR